MAVRDLLAGRPVKLQASVRWRFKLGPPISLVLLVENMHAGSAAFLRITIVDPLSLNSWVSLVWPTFSFPFFCNMYLNFLFYFSLFSFFYFDLILNFFFLLLFNIIIMGHRSKRKCGCLGADRTKSNQTTYNIRTILTI